MSDNEVAAMTIKNTVPLSYDQEILLLRQGIDRLEAQVKVLKEALEKYEYGNVKCTSYACGAYDNGEIAEKALKDCEEIK